MENIIFYSFMLGIIFGIILCLINFPKLANTFAHIIERQIYIYERQCKILWILRKRYNDKNVITLFNIGNDTNKNNRKAYSYKDFLKFIKIYIFFYWKKFKK